MLDQGIFAVKESRRCAVFCCSRKYCLSRETASCVFGSWYLYISKAKNMEITKAVQRLRFSAAVKDLALQASTTQRIRKMKAL
jgi:hypothetical protein